ncbi:MAG: MFS transporter, partial [Clostridiales bacterium]|nr:MFS transporter [Clostridiales bacterium]
MAKKEKTRPDGEHPNKIGIREAAGYMTGEAGNMFSLTYISSFLKVFYTDVLYLPTRKVARIFLFSRLWDAVNDPLWGAIVSKRKPTADGKYRPYLKWIAVPLAISQLLCFFNIGSFTQNQALLLTFAYCTYIIFGMMYTGINVPFGSLASVITDDPDGRTLLSTFRSIGTGIGAAAPMLLAPMLIYSKVDDGSGGTYNVANGAGMFRFALVMSICAIAFYFTGYFTTKERVHSDPHASVDMKKAYGAMLKSRPFIILALTGILISGQLQFASLNQYLYKNYFCNTSLSALGTIAQ